MNTEEKIYRMAAIRGKGTAKRCRNPAHVFFEARGTDDLSALSALDDEIRKNILLYKSIELKDEIQVFDIRVKMDKYGEIVTRPIYPDASDNLQVYSHASLMQAYVKEAGNLIAKEAV